LLNGGSVATERGVVRLVNEDAEESGRLFVRIGLELWVDLDDEGGCDGGEQTGLRFESVRVHLSDLQDSRISVSCSDRRRASSRSPYRTPRLPCDIYRRIENEGLPGSSARLASGWEAFQRCPGRYKMEERTHSQVFRRASCLSLLTLSKDPGYDQVSDKHGAINTITNRTLAYFSHQGSSNEWHSAAPRT